MAIKDPVIVLLSDSPPLQHVEDGGWALGEAEHLEKTADAQERSDNQGCSTQSPAQAREAAARFRRLAHCSFQIAETQQKVITKVDEAEKEWPSSHIERERLLEMLDNFANGIYQAILPDVVAEAARQLRNSTPRTEPAT
jgi:hypothetical protein